MNALPFFFSVATSFISLAAVSPPASLAETTGNSEKETTADAVPLDVKRVILAQLGEERIRNTAYRRGMDGRGPWIVGWGRRILQWPLRPDASTREVMPEDGGRWFSNGGCMIDLDEDGEQELVIARDRPSGQRGGDLLWLDPGSDGESDGESWREHRVGGFPHIRAGHPHDIRPFRMDEADGNSIRGVISVVSRRRLVLHVIPNDPTKPWKKHPLANLPARRQSGLAIGDINGDGRPDAVCGMFWVECPKTPAADTWPIHRFGEWDKDNAGWGGMAKHALGDLDGDGQLEIVASEAETADARMSVFDRRADAPKAIWRETPIEKNLYAPHSLVLADLNRDGRKDIIVGEMTAGGWDFPMNDQPRILAYFNRGGRFERRLLEKGAGVHEMGLAPLRREGKVVIYAADEIQPQKFENMNTHVSYWLIGPAE